VDAAGSFLFDNFGYLVVPGVLSTDMVEELKATLRHPTEQFDPVAAADGPLHWGIAWRSLLDLPELRGSLEALVGNHELRQFRIQQDGPDPLPTYRLDHINVHTHVGKGFGGMPLHGGWRATGGSQFFRYHDGEFFNGLVVVAFELFDTHANGGGFCCIPGSHKGNLALPEGWEVPGAAPDQVIKRIPARAGDAIIFTEALIHGSAPWEVDYPRQTAFYKFSPHGTSWSADHFDPAHFRHYADMDDRKLALLEPPNARYRGRRTRPERR